jgi:CheY-like chemotaxis protein
MKAHGGELRVETSENGSTFHVVLPMEKAVVLLVDDQEVHRAIMKEQLLTVSDVEFVEANNGKQALERLKEAKPILVITDLNMPEMDGFQLLKEIRSIWSSDELPVIVSTALSSSGSREGGSIDTKTTAFNYGANDFIMKPIVPEDFIPRVKRYLP